MIKHIVMFRVKKDESHKPNLVRLTESLEALPQKISEIVEWEVGRNFSPSPKAFDLVLISSFQNLDDLKTYQQHPDHVTVVNLIKEITDDRVVVDFEV